MILKNKKSQSGFFRTIRSLINWSYGYFSVKTIVLFITIYTASLLFAIAQLCLKEKNLKCNTLKRRKRKKKKLVNDSLDEDSKTPRFNIIEHFYHKERFEAGRYLFLGLPLLPDPVHIQLILSGFARALRIRAW